MHDRLRHRAQVAHAVVNDGDFVIHTREGSQASLGGWNHAG